MGKGRKKTPTKIKEMQGTLEKSRTIENEMVVDLVSKLPTAPDWLSEIGKKEFVKVTTQLFNLEMLYSVDLRLVEAYANEISLYLECEMKLRKENRIDEFQSSEGTVLRRQASPLVKMKNDALNNSLKLAAQFGLTPVARASIAAPVLNNNTQINNYFD
jgi:P27 family predicted phage terminase small subunit